MRGQAAGENPLFAHPHVQMGELVAGSFGETKSLSSSCNGICPQDSVICHCSNNVLDFSCCCLNSLHEGTSMFNTIYF